MPHPSTDPLHDHPRYQQVRKVGQGAFGFVSEVADKHTGERHAAKFIERGGQITKYTEREIVNQLKLKHPHVVLIKEVFLTDDYLVLLMELMTGGNLLRRVSKTRGLPEDEARWFFQQIMFAIDYCHRMGVASRDIKLENTLLQDDDPLPLIKLADFGFSKDENLHSAPGSRVGTPAYLAPEIISNVEGSTYDAKLADVWSCGVLLFAMVAGHYPFQHADDAKLPPGIQLKAMLQRTLKGKFDFPTNRPMSEGLEDLISKMLVLDPQERLTVAQVLTHPWLGLGSSMSVFNDKQISASQANPPRQELLDQIAAIVEEARVHQKTNQAAASSEQAKVASAMDSQASTDYLADDMIDPDSADFDFQPV